MAFLITLDMPFYELINFNRKIYIKILIMHKQQTILFKNIFLNFDKYVYYKKSPKFILQIYISTK